MTLSDTISETEDDKRGHKSRERRCVVTGVIGDPSDMVRFVLSPDGVVTPDIAGKLPGRGVWVTADRETLEQAVKTKAFARGFKSQVKMPNDLVVMTEGFLADRVLGLIAMARKSGAITMGFDQVQKTARMNPLAFRIEASDGSADGRGKIRVLAKAMSHEMELKMPEVIGCFDSQALGRAVGRDNLVHAAIPRGGLARSLSVHAKRLSGFKDLIPSNWPDRAHEEVK